MRVLCLMLPPSSLLLWMTKLHENFEKLDSWNFWQICLSQTWPVSPHKSWQLIGNFLSHISALTLSNSYIYIIFLIHASLSANRCFSFPSCRKDNLLANLGTWMCTTNYALHLAWHDQTQSFHRITERLTWVSSKLLPLPQERLTSKSRLGCSRPSSGKCQKSPKMQISPTALCTCSNSCCSNLCCSPCSGRVFPAHTEPGCNRDMSTSLQTSLIQSFPRSDVPGV